MRRQWLTPVLLAALVLAGGCAGEKSDRQVASVSGSATPTLAPVAEQGEFNKCMKDNGVDLEAQGDTQSLTDGQRSYSDEIDETESPEEQRRQLAALEQCRRYLPDGGKPKQLSPDALEQERILAKCMRDAGFDYPDPDPHVGGNGARAIPPGIDIKDPAVLEKLRACQRAAGQGPSAGGTGS